MMLPPFFVYFSARGTHIAPQKLKVSRLHCYNLLVAGTPISSYHNGSSSTHPRFSSWSTAETLCCVPSHAGRFTSLPTPTPNWQPRGSGQARGSPGRATMPSEEERAEMQALDRKLDAIA